MPRFEFRLSCLFYDLEHSLVSVFVSSLEDVRTVLVLERQGYREGGLMHAGRARWSAPLGLPVSPPSCALSTCTECSADICRALNLTVEIFERANSDQSQKP